MNLVREISEKKNLLLRKQNIYSLLLISLIFGLDRFSKIKILNNFSDNTYFVSNYINLDLIWNTGIGFGLLSSDSNVIYNVITIIIFLVILILFYLAAVSRKLDNIIFSIIIGGALGNLYDRLFYSAVPDFIDLHYENLHWFTFNLADIFITLGIITFIAKDFFVINK
jgi:signal peptidase II|tara:strand:- start:1165 stop:1668 length:504 start_codon:yes stop_codon:yes gene_type:complete